MQNDSSGWYDAVDTVGDDDGDTDISGLAVNSPCYLAITGVQTEAGKAYQTAEWYARNGTAAQQTIAKRMLRAACDRGGKSACDYFIVECRDNGSGSAPYCDDTSDFTDLTYYLHQDKTNHTNSGASYIVKKLGETIITNFTVLNNEINYACGNSQAPNANQNLDSNLACHVTHPKLLINECNEGSVAACDEANDPDGDNDDSDSYNNSCTDIKTAWPGASDGFYKLTYNWDGTVGSLEEVYCDMTNLASAAISGCDAETYVPEDCNAGYSNNYNKSCSQIQTMWDDAPTGGHNLTTALDTAPTYNTCGGASCTSYVSGDPCPDGTYYIGILGNYNYFTTPEDEPGVHSYNSGNDDSDGWYTTGANNSVEGRSDTYNINNYDILTNITATTSGAPYNAALACALKNNGAGISYDGGVTYHNDWFLPAQAELSLMYIAYAGSGVPGITAGFYWTSTEFTETSNIQAISVDFTDGSLSAPDTDDSYKFTRHRVRCVRREVID